MNIDSFQQALNQKLIEQQVILKTSTEDADSIRRPHFRDGGEIAEERERAVIIDNTLQQTQQNIIQIEKALAKIAAVEFGFCDRYGDKISSQRLTIFPEAAFCISCQDKIDN